MTNAPLTSIITATSLDPRRLAWLEEASSSVRERRAEFPICWIVCISVSSVSSPALVPESVRLEADVLLVVYGSVSDARNAALSEVATEFVCTLDDDDVLLPGSVIVREESLKSNPGIGWVAGHMRDVVEGELQEVWEQPFTEGLKPRGAVLDEWGSPEDWFCCLTHAFLFRTSALRKAAPMGWEDIGQEDIMVVCRVSERFPGVVLPQPVIGYRRHNEQVSRSEAAVSTRVAESQHIWDTLRPSGK